MPAPALTQEVRDKRVAVAKDALTQALFGNYRFKTNNAYVHNAYDLGDESLNFDDQAKTVDELLVGRHGEGCRVKNEFGKYEYDLQKVVDTVAERCEVCMLGSLFLSKARLFDGIVLDAGSVFNAEWPQVKKGLADVFDHETTQYLEAVFEGYDCIFPRIYDFRKDAIALACRAGMDAALGVAVAVLLNLVKNEGEFDVSQKPSVKITKKLEKELRGMIADA